MAKSRDQVKALRQKRNQKYKTENEALKTTKNWYPTTDSKKVFTRKCKLPKPTKLRQEITPGTILIILAGRFRGRRVVFLKQLKSGLLLVTGPYKLNGVPLKRVNQSYVIATRTKIDLGSISVQNIEDDLFKKTVVKRTELGEVIMPKDNAEKKQRISKERQEAQSKVDTTVIKAVTGTPYLKEYLRNRFALKNGQQLHNLVF